jgi:hypothetical protein
MKSKPTMSIPAAYPSATEATLEMVRAAPWGKNWGELAVEIAAARGGEEVLPGLFAQLEAAPLYQGVGENRKRLVLRASTSARGKAPSLLLLKRNPAHAPVPLHGVIWVRVPE